MRRWCCYFPTVAGSQILRGRKAYGPPLPVGTSDKCYVDPRHSQYRLGPWTIIRVKLSPCRITPIPNSGNRPMIRWDHGHSCASPLQRIVNFSIFSMDDEPAVRTQLTQQALRHQSSVLRFHSGPLIGLLNQDYIEGLIAQLIHTPFQIDMPRSAT